MKLLATGAYPLLNPFKDEFKYLLRGAAVKEMVMVDAKLVVATNPALKMATVEHIVERGWNPHIGLALPAKQENGLFILRNGNHRFEALKRLGEPFIPIFLMTQYEWDEANRIGGAFGFILRVPEHPMHYTA